MNNKDPNNRNNNKRRLPEIHPIIASKKIAREARERVQLIASRIPKLGIFPTREKEVERVERLVVISDTHFGDMYQQLTNPMLLNALVHNLKGLGYIDELVLLGDVFDFWKAPIKDAVEQSKEFLAAILSLDNLGKVIYLPGNHDHHVFRMYYDDLVKQKLEEGDLEPPELVMPVTAGCPLIDAVKPDDADVPLYMVYPTYEVKVGEKSVLLTHGHLLGFFERSLWHPRSTRFASLVVSKNERLSLEDMENFISPIYEMTALSAMVPGVIDGRYRVYRMMNRVGRALGFQGTERESAYRNRTLENSAAEVEALLDHFCVEVPDYFVFGHTHQPGQLILPVSGTTAINTGCWLSEEIAEGPTNVLLEIAEHARLFSVNI